MPRITNTTKKQLDWSNEMLKAGRELLVDGTTEYYGKTIVNYSFMREDGSKESLRLYPEDFVNFAKHSFVKKLNQILA